MRNSRPSFNLRATMPASWSGSAWSRAVDVRSNAESMRYAAPSGCSAAATAFQNGSKRSRGTCDSQKLKNTASSRCGGFHVFDIVGRDSRAIDRQHFGRRIDCGQVFDTGCEMPREKARAAGKLEHL